MMGHSYIGYTGDNIMCLVEQPSRPRFGTSGAFGVQASDSMAQIFTEPFFIALRVVQVAAFTRISICCFLFPTQYSLPTCLPGGSFQWDCLFAFYIYCLHVLFRIKGTIFPLNRSHS